MPLLSAQLQLKSDFEMERTVVRWLLFLLIKKLDLTRKLKNGEVRTDADLLVPESCEGLYLYFSNIKHPGCWHEADACDVIQNISMPSSVILPPTVQQLCKLYLVTRKTNR